MEKIIHLAQNSILRRILLPVFVFIVITASVFFAWRFELDSVESKAKTKFDSETEEIIDLIEKRLEVYTNVLTGGRALFLSSDNVSRSEWKSYVDSISLQEKYPGVQGMGFSLFIKPQEKESHIKSIRAEGFPEYSIRPEGERDTYTSIVYLEPFKDRNLRAFGYDMYSEPVRHEAMNRAIITGNSSLSGKVTLVQENNKDVQYGFLMYLPIYKKGTDVSSSNLRRENIYGFIYSPFRIKDFMNGIFGNKKYDIDFEVYDTEVIKSDNEMFDSDFGKFSKDSVYEPRFIEDKKINLYGHTWSIKFVSLPGFKLNSDEDVLANYILIGGLVLALLITLLVFVVVNAENAAQSLAKKMSQKAEQTSLELKSLVENMPLGILYEDNNRLMRLTNIYFCRIFGINARPDELVGSDCAKAAIDSAQLFVNSEEFIERIQKIVNDRQPIANDLLTLKDGRIFQRDYIPVVSGQTYFGHLWLYRDVTNQKKSENEIKKHADELARINQIMIGRELKMVELKRELEELRGK